MQDNRNNISTLSNNSNYWKAVNWNKTSESDNVHDKNPHFYRTSFFLIFPKILSRYVCFIQALNTAKKKKYI